MTVAPSPPMTSPESPSVLPVTALDRHIQRLARGERLALSAADIEALNGRGLRVSPGGLAADGRQEYCLDNSLELLDAPAIVDGLTSQSQDLLEVQVHWRIDSTNSHLMARAADPGFHGACCLAEQQLAGRGRRGRQWQSPFGRNIYLSLGWRFADTAALGGLSLLVGMQLVDVLRRAGVKDLGLKWPNDVLLEGGKLAGILIEVAPARGRDRHVVIGIGVNLSLDAVTAQGIDQPWSVLPGALNLSRNSLCASLLNALVTALTQFNDQGFADRAMQWQDYNLYTGRGVCILQGSEQIMGVDRGVDAEGNLLLETDAGLQSFNAGEVSLRPASPSDR